MRIWLVGSRYIPWLLGPGIQAGTTVRSNGIRACFAEIDGGTAEDCSNAGSRIFRAT